MPSIIMTSLRRSLFVLVTLAVLQAQAHSQTPAPATAPTIKARAQIVIVDVVVTDKNQNPVHNLKQSDFNVLENNTPQTISHFEEHIPIPRRRRSSTFPRCRPASSPTTLLSLPATPSTSFCSTRLTRR